MDLSFLGWVELPLSFSLSWVGLHPAGSSAFMQSPPSNAGTAEIWPLRIGRDSGEIK